jgi:hypothetical protein
MSEDPELDAKIRDCCATGDQLARDAAQEICKRKEALLKAALEYNAFAGQFNQEAVAIDFRAVFESHRINLLSLGQSYARPAGFQPPEVIKPERRLDYRDVVAERVYQEQRARMATCGLDQGQVGPIEGATAKAARLKPGNFSRENKHANKWRFHQELSSYTAQLTCCRHDDCIGRPDCPEFAGVDS